MISVEVAVTVDRPRQDVFAFVTDLRNDPLWWRGVRSVKRLSGGGAVGTRYRMESSLLGVSDTAEIEVVAYDPPVGQTIAVRQGKLSYTAVYDLVEVGESRTRFLMRAEITGSAAWNWLGPLLRPLLRLVARYYFRALPRAMAASA